MSGPDPKRRFSRPELPSGISAIFNPRKLRRNSTAVSQLLEQQQLQSHPPSVVVTGGEAGFCIGEEYNLGSTSSLYTRMANGPPMSQSQQMAHHSGHEAGGGVEGGGGRRVQIGSASSGTSAASVPLLTDVQFAHGSGSHRGGGLISQQSLEQMNAAAASSGHNYQSQSHNAANNNNNTSGGTRKPITRTLTTIRHAIFSKTARKVSRKPP